MLTQVQPQATKDATPFERMRKVLDYLVRNKLPPTPVNYAQAYSLVTGEVNDSLAASMMAPIDLVAGLLELIDGVCPPDAEVAAYLHKMREVVENPRVSDFGKLEKVGEIVEDARSRGFENLKFQQELSRDIQDAVNAVYAELQEATSSMSGFEVSTSSMHEKVQACTNIQDARSLLDVLLQEARGVSQMMKETTSVLSSTQNYLKKVHEQLEQLREEKELAEQTALIDPLTEVYNRRGLEVALEKIAPNRATVLSLDLDNFKSINDTYGHEIGDTVLREFVRTIKGVLRSTDIFSRHGGEEFLVVFPSTPLDAASKVAVRIVEEVQKIKIAQCSQLSEKITVSGGMAGYVAQSFSLLKFKDSILLADKHLYRAKSLGKNRVYGHIEHVDSFSR